MVVSISISSLQSSYLGKDNGDELIKLKKKNTKLFLLYNESIEVLV